MKIAYLSYLTQLDTDLAYIQEAQKKCELITYIYINPKHFNKSIIKLTKLYDKSGIFDCSIYPELEILSPLINLEKVKIINVRDEKFWKFKAFSLFLSLSRNMKKEFDIVHITSILQPPEFPLYSLRKKLILTVHDPIPHSFSENIRVKLARITSMGIVKNFIIFNKSQKEDFKKAYKLQDQHILVSRFGIFPWLKLLDDSNKISHQVEDQPYILFIGRISRYKGIEYLLPAMEEIHPQFPQINLIVAGGGSFHFDISRWQHLSYIQFRNRFIPDKELIELVKGALFVVCPYTDATQSGVVMSAFTFNKPVLATNVGGLPEMVESGRHGIIVEAKHIESLKDGMLTLLSNPTLRNNMSSNIEKDYTSGSRSWNKISDQILEYYSKMRT